MNARRRRVQRRHRKERRQLEEVRAAFRGALRRKLATVLAQNEVEENRRMFGCGLRPARGEAEYKAFIDGVVKSVRRSADGGFIATLPGYVQNIRITGSITV